MISELKVALESWTCVVVRSLGADRVRRLSVDHCNFTRIHVDEFFKCRTEYRILKYEHVKKYTFKGSEELKLNGTGCITHNFLITRKLFSSNRGTQWQSPPKYT